MKTLRINIVVFDNETNQTATAVEYNIANRESSVLVMLKKTTDKGINCKQYFGMETFKKRFSIN